MIANNPHFRPSIELCCRLSFKQLTDHRKDQISSHNNYPTFCWVNLEVFLTLGTLYCLISATRGNIVRIDSATDDTIRVSWTVAIRFTDASVNRYTPIEALWHLCVRKLTIIGPDNGLSPGQCQAITWSNAGILLIWTFRTNFSEIHTFSFRKMAATLC